ncbi:MAG: hypothetical protein ACLRS1_10390 [Oscillospiraceae bacterium]
MNEWIALEGEFKKEEEAIKFIGGNELYKDVQTNETKNGSKYGILLFNEWFFNGSIEMTVEFDDLDEDDEAEILYNYFGETDFSCVGITNALFKYECKDFNGVWNFNKAIGRTTLRKQNKYILRAEIVGSILTLFVNNIKIFSTYLVQPQNHTQVGIWVRSKSSITIYNYKVNYEKPNAFVVMQFGHSYDDLYYDVIKNVCEENGYAVYRADEGLGTGLILNDIVSAIRNSALVIADITPDNPNVFYEVGFAHALNKPTILLNEKNQREKLPFDVSGFRTIFYDNSIGGKKMVEEKLNQFIANINLNIPSGGRIITKYSNP